MKKTLLLSLLLLGMNVNSFGDTVTLNIAAGLLKTASGEAMPTTGLVILVANTNHTSFSVPEPGAFVGDGNVIVAKWDLSGWGPGELLDTATITLSGTLKPGAPLQLCWFPTLTKSSTVPGGGVAYGQYTDPVGIDGSAPWVIPAAGATVDLVLRTADAPADFSSPGSNPASVGACSAVTTGETVSTGATEVAAQMSLDIQRTEQGLRLSWPDAAGWVLQSCARFGPPGMWANWPTAPERVDGRCSLTVPTTGDAEFFRLQKQ